MFTATFAVMLLPAAASARSSGNTAGIATVNRAVSAKPAVESRSSLRVRPRRGEAVIFRPFSWNWTGAVWNVRKPMAEVSSKKCWAIRPIDG